MKNLKLIFTTAIFATLTGCVNGDDYAAPNLTNDCSDLAVTKTVQDITSMSTSTYQMYPEQPAGVIEAYVTSSDEGGNFYKSISFVSVDGLVGFSMPIDAYNLYTKYEPGRKVFVNMSKRYFVTEHSSTVIGSLYNNDTPEDDSDDEVGRISGVEYESILTKSCTKVNEDEIVKDLTIAQAQNNQYLNMLIEFDAVQFTDVSLGHTYFDRALNPFPDWTATNHEITDEFGNKITVRISEYATFASKNVPSESGKIRGVLTKYNSTFQFMVRTENDIKLTDTRMEIDFYPPIVGNSLVYNSTLNEPFTSYTTSNQQIFPAYINDAATGSRYWQVKSFGTPSNKYIQMSSFGGTAEANRTLFIVPVDMTGANNLQFKTKTGFNNGPTLKVYYTTNYVPGSQITSATLVDITSSFTISNGPSSGYPTTFTNSGVYNIPVGVTGNGFFVFEYTGNGSGGPTTTMQIDDIVIN